MKELKLLNTGRVALVDDEDYARLSLLTWTDTGFAIQHHYREKHKIGSRTFTLNTKTTKCFTVSLPCEIMHKTGVVFDHIDRNYLNNQKSNLRDCTQLQNTRNRTKALGTSSRYKGVSWHKQNKKWRATIKLNGKIIQLGCYKIEEDAARAYNKAALEFFKEFACINIIKEEATCS